MKTKLQQIRQANKTKFKQTFLCNVTRTNKEYPIKNKVRERREGKGVCVFQREISKKHKKYAGNLLRNTGET